jgi:hypothetical protein
MEIIYKITLIVPLLLQCNQAEKGYTKKATCVTGPLIPDFPPGKGIS